MVESGLVEQNDLCVPAFVFSMAMLALRFYRSRKAAVKPFLVIDIVEYVFVVMAVHAEFALPILVGLVVAFVALLFEFFMGLDDGPRHQ